MQDDEAMIQSALAGQADVPERLQKLAYPVVIDGRVRWRSTGPSRYFTCSPAKMHEIEQLLRARMHLDDGERLA